MCEFEYYSTERAIWQDGGRAMYPVRRHSATGQSYPENQVYLTPLSKSQGAPKEERRVLKPWKANRLLLRLLC
jgi:hypothetical protein